MDDLRHQQERESVGEQLEEAFRDGHDSYEQMCAIRDFTDVFESQGYACKEIEELKDEIIRKAPTEHEADMAHIGAAIRKALAEIRAARKQKRRAAAAGERRSE